MRTRRYEQSSVGRDRVWIIRTGSSWRDLSVEFSKWNTIFLSGVFCAITRPTATSCQPFPYLLSSFQVNLNRIWSGC
ncbi:hypothetical protein ABF86_07890 [Nitrosomonas sp. GH22]|nr:hypothetical protein [Nitrosomonas sp. GH22]